MSAYIARVILGLEHAHNLCALHSCGARGMVIDLSCVSLSSLGPLYLHTKVCSHYIQL